MLLPTRLAWPVAKRWRTGIRLGEIHRMIIAILVSAIAAAHAPPRRPVKIVGFEYAFKAPAELPPGPVVFRFVNEGKVEHELNIVLLAPGVTLARYIAATNADTTAGAADPMIESTIGVLFAGPGGGSASALSTELLPGRIYALRCVLTNSVHAPAHQTLGMFSAIRVTSGNAPVSIGPPADTIVGTDYAFRYPQTLRPGLHEFAFVNAGKHRHELLMYLLKRGVTMHQVIEVANAGGNPRRFFDAGLGVLHARAGTSPRGRLQVRLLPGRDYMIACTFQDSPSAPPHFKLGMVGRIHVTGAPAGR